MTEIDRRSKVPRRRESRGGRRANDSATADVDAPNVRDYERAWAARPPQPLSDSQPQHISPHEDAK
jgi:hypothetical protein